MEKKSNSECCQAETVWEQSGPTNKLTANIQHAWVLASPATSFRVPLHYVACGHESDLKAWEHKSCSMY